jgi:DNA-directed RNA polymerase specialized sigma24 family protein
LPIPNPIRGKRTNEELFFEYYPQILEWASQLAHLDRADAEDLVQDFYIQVKCINMSLAEVDEIEPYLFKILRNLHYTRLRRKGRSPISEISIAEYDSLERGLVAVDRRDLFLVHANLKEICEYACQRKSTAIRASIFILRFFFGYRPSDVMKVVLASRTAVDRSLQLARREALEYLDRPHANSSVTHQEQQTISTDTGSDPSHALFLELRRIIFSFCEGSCFERGVLEQRYQAKSPVRFTIQELSHLVSCKTCLDRVNAVLGIPLLDSRSPDDTIGRDNPPGSGDSAPRLTITRGRKRGAGPKEREALDRRMQEFLEHRPTRLEIAVNGETRTSQRVTAEVNELHLKLNAVEEPKFVEVFSEQGVRLAYLHVTEPTLYPSLEQRQHIALSDGRSLDLTLAFASDLPTVRVVYNDPIFAQVLAFDDDTDALDVDESSIKDSCQVDRITEPKSVIQLPVQHWITFKGLKFFKVPTLHMNPLFTSVIVLALASVFCLFLWLRNGPGITSSAFLARAQMRDSSVAANPQPGVIFQKVSIKTPTGTTETTLYRDVQHRRRTREHGLDANDSRLRDKLKTAGIDWNDPLSTATYRDWRDHEAITSDSVKRTGNNLLTLTTVVNDNAVISQSLTVRETDYHPVERTIELRNYGTVEIAELDYSVLPWNSVNPDLFEPLAAAPSMLGGDVRASILPHLPATLTPIQIDEAELAVRLVLNRLHLDSSGRIALSQSAEGVHVQGIVETDDEKRQLQSELYLVPHVRSSILTVREMASKPGAGSEVTSIRQSSVDVAQPSAIEKYFDERGIDRTAVSVSAQRFVDSSITVGRESRAISDLLDRFASRDALSGPARTSLSELLIQHKAALLAALGKEERELVVLQLIPHPVSEAGEVQSNTDALKLAAERNFNLSVELTSGSATTQRSAQSLAPQLADSIAQLRAVVLHISAAQLHPPSSANSAVATQNR